ncbi:MAG: ABC transporter ATP-binding protein [Lachnospiraceae bacterium]|nr:ABC transporter ATP-binding protein [Lachnospiraceae bacterium]
MKRQKEAAQKETLKRILGLMRPYWWMAALILLFAVITVAATLYGPILIGQGVDLIIGQGNVDFAGLRSLILRFLLMIAVTGISQWLMSLMTNRITYQVVRDMRVQAFNRMEELPLKYMDNHQPGDALSRIITDVEQFSDGLLMGFTQLFTGVLTIVGTLCFMLTLDLATTVLVVCLTPLSFFVAGFIAKRTYTMFKLQSETRSEMTSLVEEMVGNEKIVQAFSYEERAEERFAGINERLRVCGIRALFFSSLTNPATRFINGLVYAGVGVLGALKAITGTISVGDLSAFLTYANQYTKPFNEISGVVTELQNALACAQRLFAFIDEPPVTPDDDDAVVLEKGKGRVEFDQVGFSYDPKVPLIENLNLKVEPGQRIAIVGPTGCGKTTLINLLMRFYDVNTGTLKIDGTPIGHITRNSLRANFGMVLQETWLKAGTIHENIAYGRPDASREEVVEAAKRVHAHSFISRLPQGYDTVIAEDGGNISQGQKQLLCIARVMLMHPPILILDEATSSIDTRTEMKVQRAFEELMRGRTSFIVAHRLSTVRNADRILVMKDGKIIESGRHEELLEQNGFYKQLYESQFAATV